MSSPSATATSKRRSIWRAWRRGRRRAVELRWASTVSSILGLPTTITSSPPPVAPFRPVISISLPAPRPPSPSQDPSQDLPRLCFVGGQEHQRLVVGASTVPPMDKEEDDGSCPVSGCCMSQCQRFLVKIFVWVLEMPRRWWTGSCFRSSRRITCNTPSSTSKDVVHTELVN